MSNQNQQALLITFNITTGLIVDGRAQLATFMAMSVGEFCAYLQEIGVANPVQLELVAQ